VTLSKDFGLPQAIRTDKGIPFARGNALYGLSKLSVWWLRLGIQIEPIQPGQPEQNGRHERLHLTLKNEATRPALMTFSTTTTGNGRIRLSRWRPRPICTPDRTGLIPDSAPSATRFMTGLLQ
jgi:hypothetical protein